MTIEPGQIYRSRDPRDVPPIRIRINAYMPGHDQAHVVDADTGKRPRWIRIVSLHASATTKAGQARVTGYVLEQAADGGQR